MNAPFAYEQTALQLISADLRRRTFQRITRDSTNLFLRGRDIISVSPQVFGTHEPALTRLIETFAREGQGDFLIDIGANIGLTSCQNGSSFKAVHLFEPNPLCCHILAVNTRIALPAGQYQIHPYGLGESDKKVQLTVPRHNWGGAFVNDAANSYDAALLAGKDGLQQIHEQSYYTVDIEIRDTQTELQQLFRSLAERGLKNGVIKIDVEGYEPVVLAGIARAIPADMTVAVAFESWNANCKLDDTLAAFGGRAKGYKLVRRTPWRQEMPRLVKAACLLWNRKIVTTLEPITAGDCFGELVLKVDRKAA